MFKKKKTKVSQPIRKEQLEAKVIAELKEKLEQLKKEMEKEKDNKLFVQIEESTPVEKPQSQNQ